MMGELPLPEAREALYREMQEKGGLPFEHLLDTAGPEFEPRL
jgi:hypothetical protein